MDFVELRNFIANQMRMQHIYQPVMIKILLESDNNKASVRKIAHAFLQKDESQLEYYMQITKAMPGKVLGRHRVVNYESGNFYLNVESVSPSERSDLIQLCEEKIIEYENARGRLIWQHRSPDQKYIPGSLRYQILKQAKFRCELCGISAEQKALDVDHITPRNKGGKTVLENLQALCFTCNAQKRDLDATDFRPWKSMNENRDMTCVFCNTELSSIKARNSLAVSFEDRYPVVKGYSLIAPIRHVNSFFDLGSAEQKACFAALEETKIQLVANDQSISGFNLGVNDGVDAGQTILHCHIHLIPGRKGDVSDPKGGIRHIIPGKGFYG
jgi:ATP adenylyltransferase